MGSAPDVTASGGTYFYKQDYMSDLSKKCASKDFAQVSKILTNMGTSDKATNWLLEQRTLHRAHANEGKEIRNMIDDKVSFRFYILIIINIIDCGLHRIFKN